MIRFVVVEDDKEYHLCVKDVIRKAMFKYDSIYKIDFYEKMNSALDKVIKEEADKKIYILDIELTNSISGIEIAKLIRENDWESHIIFLTSHDYQFHKVFSTVLEVFAFIEKFENMEEKLTEAISSIASKNFDNKMLKITTRNTDINIYYKAITHIVRDKEDRKLIINTSVNKFYTNLTLKDIKKLLDGRFKYTNRACIVNVDHVQKYDWSKGFFLLDTGEKVYYLSKKYKKEIVEK